MKIATHLERTRFMSTDQLHELKSNEKWQLQMLFFVKIYLAIFAINKFVKFLRCRM